MSSASTFPGHVYDEYFDALSPEAPELMQDQVNGYTCKALLTEDGAASISLIWVLNPGARFAAIPAAHVTMAIEELRRPDRSMLLLTTDPAAEEDVREGLLNRLNLDTMPSGWMGRA